MSLAEAINLANADPDHTTITIDPTYTVVLNSTLPDIIEETTIVGSGNLIDGSGLGPNKNCIRIFGSNISISGLEINNCTKNPIAVFDGGSNQIFNNIFRSNGAAVACFGGVGANIFGPGNLVEDSSDQGFYSLCPDDIIIENEIFYSTVYGIFAGADGIRIIGNLIVGGERNIHVSSGSTSLVIWHNTLVKSSFAAIGLSSGTVVEAINNIVAYNSGFGLFPSSGTITHDYNLFYDNLGGDCDGCTVGGNSPNALPIFVNEATDNYLLDTGSPAINTGTTTGWDANGADPGLFNGAAPDKGYHETN
jgi:hypothetical protein